LRYSSDGAVVRAVRFVRVHRPVWQVTGGLLLGGLSCATVSPWAGLHVELSASPSSRRSPPRMDTGAGGRRKR